MYSHETHESGIDTSPDMNTSAESAEIDSPERILTVQPRKLLFLTPDSNSNKNSLVTMTNLPTITISKHNDICSTKANISTSVADSPPYRRVQALR